MDENYPLYLGQQRKFTRFSRYKGVYVLLELVLYMLARATD